MLCFVLYREKEEGKWGGLHQAFTDVLENMHLKKIFTPLFTLLDPIGHTQWPKGFKEFVETKAVVDLQKNSTAIRLRKHGGFSEANIAQLCFAEKIEIRGQETRKVINNFFNPNWPKDFGSGGNEEGHLLLLRKFYHKNEVCEKNARTNVKAFLRQLKQYPNRESSLYRIKIDRTEQEEEDEIMRIANIESENFDLNWYPNQWLSFYLFGKPSHGTDDHTSYTTLMSGKPEPPKSNDQFKQALANLNTELGTKHVRHNDPKRKKGKPGVADVDVAIPDTVDKTVNINHNFSRGQLKRSKEDRLKDAFELLRGNDIDSDEDSGFSKRKMKQSVGMQLLNALLHNEEDEDNEVVELPLTRARDSL